MTRILSILCLLACPWMCSAVVPQITTNITLAWDMAPNAVGYKVLYGPASGNYTNSISVGNTNTAVVSNLVIGARYYFTAQSVGVSGLLSAMTGEISAIAGDTNVYVTVTNVFFRHVRPLIGSFTIPSTNWQFVLWITNDDIRGAITALKPFLAWGKEATNWPVATNFVTLTNPPPNGIVQNLKALMPPTPK